MGMLCSAGLTTMGELLDPYGWWDRDLIAAEIPVAVEIETKREVAFYRAALAAVSAVLGGGTTGKKYTGLMQKVIDEARDELRASRGLKPGKRESQDAKTLREAFGGLKPATRKKGKGKK